MFKKCDNNTPDCPRGRRGTGLRLVRKFLIVLSCLLYLFIYPRPCEVYCLGLAAGADIFFYTAEKPGFECRYVYNGVNYEIATDEAGAADIRRKIEPLYQTAVFYGDIAGVLRRLKICVKETAFIGGGILYSGYSQIVRGEGRGGVNVQVYEKGGRIYVGSPLIAGGY